MKLNKTLFFIPLLFLMLTASSFAHDTDLYTTASEGVKSNILFIIDNSCSMKSSVSTGTTPYDKTFTYPADPYYPNINKDYVYEYTTSWEKTLQTLKVFKTSISAVACSKARDDLTNKGVTYNRYTNSNCNKDQKTLATGNFLNYYLYNDKWLPSLPKIDIAKRVITDILETMNGVNVGLMIFTPGGDGGKVITYINDIDIDNHRAKIISDVNAIVNECGTPLGKTLYEAGLYFGGKASYFNAPLNYKSYDPIKYSCQKNFVIFMTDGMASSDDDSPTPLPANIGDQNGDGKEPPVGSDHNDFLDDVAKYLYDNDIDPDFAGTQNVVTYTIGFDIGSDADAKDLLGRTALYGHGKFYMSQDALSLAGAFATAVDEVLAKTTSYVAPIVPVSRFEKTTAGDKIYIALFKPALMGMWKGNIKKYGVAQTMNAFTRTNVGDILDVYGKKAVDSEGKFYPSSKSFWSSTVDGGEVEQGGVGDVLLRRDFASSPRKIYTFLPGDDQDADVPDTNGNTSYDLTNAWNAFTIANSRLTSSILAVSSDQRDKLINFVHGYDAYDDNGNTITSEKRPWILGSFIHSRPFIIHYGPEASKPSVIFAGANDGMLHAFRDSDGEELWAFIPPILLGRLNELHTNTPGMFVDGSPKAHITYDASGNVTKAILIFGLRRGGNYYYALDVTVPDAPKYLWRIYKDKGGGFKELAQTWSNPVIGKVPYGSQTSNPPGEKWVVIFGGGYDTNQDSLNPAPYDSVGRGVYMADVETGSYVWWKSYPGGVTTMTHSIPSDVTKLDMEGDGRIDRLYVGDIKARMWRFDIGDLNKDGNSDPNEWTGRIIFKSNVGDTDKRKIFYPPDVTLENGYEMLFFGTGDREDPKCLKVPPDINRIYGLKDKNSMAILEEKDLADVTEDYLQAGTAGQQATWQALLNTKSGWFIIVTKQAGEACLATPVVFYRTVYFTTFAPTEISAIDPCLVGEGVAFLYAVDYMNGNAVFNFDLTNDVGGTVLAKSDRSLRIGTAIPSGVVITVVGNTAVGYAGVGGGVFRPQMKKTKTFYPLHWKIVF